MPAGQSRARPALRTVADPRLRVSGPTRWHAPSTSPCPFILPIVQPSHSLRPMDFEKITWCISSTTAGGTALPELHVYLDCAKGREERAACATMAVVSSFPHHVEDGHQRSRLSLAGRCGLCLAWALLLPVLRPETCQHGGREGTKAPVHDNIHVSFPARLFAVIVKGSEALASPPRQAVDRPSSHATIRARPPATPGCSEVLVRAAPVNHSDRKRGQHVSAATPLTTTVRRRKRIVKVRQQGP